MNAGSTRAITPYSGGAFFASNFCSVGCRIWFTLCEPIPAVGGALKALVPAVLATDAFSLASAVARLGSSGGADLRSRSSEGGLVKQPLSATHAMAPIKTKQPQSAHLSDRGLEGVDGVWVRWLHDFVEIGGVAARGS